MLTREEELRLECLRIVTGALRGDYPAPVIVDAARKFYDFVTSTDKVDTASNQIIGTQKARVSACIGAADAKSAQQPVNAELFNVLRNELRRLQPDNGMLRFVEESLRNA